jgi:deoxyribodipyrimidine photolyase
MALFHFSRRTKTKPCFFYAEILDFAEVSLENAAQDRQTAKASTASASRSAARLGFILECLADLDESLRKTGGQLIIFKKGSDICELLKLFKGVLNLKTFTFERVS